MWSVTQSTWSFLSSAALTTSSGSEMESGSFRKSTLDSPEYFVCVCRSALPSIALECR